MNRPLVIRQIDTHVGRKAVTPFRLRAVEAERLLKYVEYLEARNARLAYLESNARAPQSAQPKVDVEDFVARRSLVSLEPEERVLSERIADERDLLGPGGSEVKEWRCPKCGVGPDERWDCCEVHAATA